ncbi:tannase/feruloyl esterase family alpha/beta hydrolase [Tropicimonas isoalkanivorans]|uniref:Feruloyl esterase n=1 Tax=Tropicimonas isoalkanivorans TaxID=441112 RepID=A0A1I1JX28_9RHOB|nr:tannase/feruloyl esterase family alpha/beta hydrolase [Tropicimonas isoalkanivorans]SFC49920.1 feruloyl esterase [Tropicimonas isoalkanivorans]
MGNRVGTVVLAGAVLLCATQSALAAGECAALAKAAPEGVTITEAVQTPASDEVPVDHCLVRGRMAERTGSDGTPYAISFELRLPDTWQHRFLHQFNGGNDGKVVPALGEGTGIATGNSALARGFAVVSSDAGHDGTAHPEAGLTAGNLFGFDFEARRDYGYAAVVKLHPVALALVERHYGRPPDYVYGYGRSNGGRHAMVAAERMPAAFDGLLAGYPGFNLPKAAIQHAWDVQTLRSVGDTLAEAFSRDEMTLVSQAISEACDGLDGLEDGAVFATYACQDAFDPASLACADGQDGACLPADKVAALERLHAGPSDSTGTPLYNSWYWDPGLNSGNWRFWKLESTVPPWGMKPIIAVMGAGSLAEIFTTPPTEVEGTPEALEAYLMGFDFDTDAPKIHAMTDAFPESAMELMTPPAVDAPTLSAFKDAGGKLILFHGTSDPVFSFKDTADWYDRLSANNPEAEAFTRFYAIPGMPHGQGGNAPDEVDLLGALVDWVEGGAQPGAVPAQFRTDSKEVREANAGAHRPLCPYPAYAVFTGEDPRSADSFECR